MNPANVSSSKTKSVRYQSSLRIGGWPLIAIATGPDLATGESRGHAKGIIAIGDLATGVIAIGGLAGGLVSVGGVSAGLVSIGGVSLGALVLGGVALGFAATGGVAVGQYAQGGVAVGSYRIGPQHRDAEAVQFFGPLAIQPKQRAELEKPKAE